MRWDIFCTVVDNFGDIGVCWRLARQLVAERGFIVRLWVDDLASFSRLAPRLDPCALAQTIDGVEVRRWCGEFDAGASPADVVIEGFACALPEPYVAAMAARAQPPVWINLEYLSAEPWVAGCHMRASPDPRRPLVKHFFFPGFTPETGGLLRERDLLDRRDAFRADAGARAAFWRDSGFDPPPPDALVVSLFGYRNAAVVELMQAFADCGRPLVCALCDSQLLRGAAAFCGCESPQVGQQFERGGLLLRAMPFVAQPRYDELLWASDLNFVRGEDSFVRAQWAARPLVWQIYPQAADAHWPKLDAFGIRYCEGLAAAPAQALTGLWRAWNGAGGISEAWRAALPWLSVLDPHAARWARQLAGQRDLAGRLTAFCVNRLK